jgi:hypothetical protein
MLWHPQVSVLMVTLVSDAPSVQASRGLACAVFADLAVEGRLASAGEL